MSYWELNDEQRRSFMGRCFRFAPIEGPQELYSFSWRPDRPTKPIAEKPECLDPMYFMTKSNLIEAIRLSSKSSSGDVFEFVRRGVALCEDWNDMRWMFVLDLPPGVALEAWFGIAKFQPRLASKEYKGGASLSGGWLQYVIRFDHRTLWLVRDAIRTGIT